MESFFSSSGPRRLSMVALIGSAIALLGTGRAMSATFTVCQSGCQYSTIPAALAVAGDGDTIAIGPGTYAGGFTITASVRLVGAGENVTTISGGGSVVTVGRGAAAEIRQVTISGGHGTAFGGGIFNGGSLSLGNSTVRGNVAGFEEFPGEGGGIFNDVGAQVTLTHSTIISNGAPEGAGIRNLGTMVIGNSTVARNVAGSTSAGSQSSFGAGISNSGILRVTNTGLIENEASDGIVGGCGIVNHFGAAARLVNSPIRGNACSTPVIAAIGGGLMNAGDMTLINSPVTSNIADTPAGRAAGGGIDNVGTLTLTNSPVTSNTASAGDGFATGGGISNAGSLRLVNSPVRANAAIGRDAVGGGIYNIFPQLLRLIHSPVLGNEPDDCVGC